MVAVAVAMGYLVFLMVDQGADEEAPALLTFERDSAAKAVRVLSAPTGANWGNLRIVVSCSTGAPSLALNGTAVPLVEGVADPVDASPEPAPVLPTVDMLAVACSTTAPETQVTLSVASRSPNSLLGSWTFTYA